MMERFLADLDRIYAAGYSTGGETMPQSVALRPDLYAAYLHEASQWDGTYAPLAENRTAVYIFMAENDEYYGSQKDRDAYSRLCTAYREAGLSDEEIDDLPKLDFPEEKINERDITMKKILSAMLTIAMLLALCAGTASAAEFPDVPAGSDYAQAVQWVSQQGYINGYNDGRFGVNDNVTRAQLSAILYRAAGSPASSGTTRFPDVASTAYYVDAASWAADGGLINGYSDGRFGVNDPITRQQVTAIFWRWAGSPAASAEDYADEASISDYAKTAVDWARANGIVPAKDGNRFAPADNATRGEIALILYNYMNQDSQPVTPSAGSGAKILVAYFSATGSTQAVANTIASTLNADTFEITPANPYSSADLNWTDSSSRVNDEHDDVSKRNIALVKDTVDNWADYDVVFIGYPIWWGIAAWPVDTFVKANDFTGKTVIPFCTSSSSGLGQSGQLLEEMANGGDWQEGQRFSSGASAATVTAWVEGLELK